MPCRQRRRGELNLSTRCGWVVSSISQPLHSRKGTPMSSVQEAGWAPGPVWTAVKDRKSVPATGVWTPNHPTRSKSFFLFPNFYYKLYILWTVHRETHTWQRPTRCALSSMCFEKIIVYHQEKFCTNSLQYCTVNLYEESSSWHDRLIQSCRRLDFS
jgi:hypothetical protein